MNGNRLFLGLMAVLNLFLAYHLIWSDQGVFAYLELKARHAEFEEKIQKLDASNLEYSKEIRLLKSDRSYIEKIIRRRMNFVKNDEVLYVFPNTVPGDSSREGPNEDEN